MAKYWVANNHKSEINDTKAQKLAELSATSVTLAELNALDAGAAVGDAVSCTVTSASTTASDTVANKFTVQFTDSAGANVTKAIPFDYYISTDSAGATVAGASEGITDAGKGFLLGEFTQHISGRFVSDATGAAEVNVADSAIALYFNVIAPDGNIFTSGICTWS